eukprot:scaffold10348_cov125-Isochrysis_galbana.AAC.9
MAEPPLARARIFLATEERVRDEEQRRAQRARLVHLSAPGRRGGVFRVARLRAPQRPTGEREDFRLPGRRASCAPSQAPQQASPLRMEAKMGAAAGSSLARPSHPRDRIPRLEHRLVDLGPPRHKHQRALHPGLVDAVPVLSRERLGLRSEDKVDRTEQGLGQSGRQGQAEVEHGRGGAGAATGGRGGQDYPGQRRRAQGGGDEQGGPDRLVEVERDEVWA